MTDGPASVVAVDVGASSGRVVHALVSPGALTLREVARFPNAPVPRRHTLRWDFESLVRHVVEGVAAAAAGPEGIDSVGIDTWGVDYGLLDDGGSLVEPPYCYRDPRTEGMPELAETAIPAHSLYARTGTAPMAVQTRYQLMAARADPCLGRAAHALLMPDLLNYRLTGTLHTEATNASTTGLLDPARRTFDPRVTAALSIPAGLFPPVGEPGCPLGVIAAGRFPPAGGPDLAGVPVTSVASHDTASAVVAVPALGSRWAFLSCGTWSILGLERRAPLLDPRGLDIGASNELGADGTVRYVRNGPGLWLVSECVREWSEGGHPVDLPGLLRQAALVPPLRTVVDPDDPRFVAPGPMTDRIVRAAREAGQPEPDGRAGVVRCILDSLAVAFGRALRAMGRISGQEVDVVHLVGGGAHNELLCQLAADACGCAVVAGPAEATAIGNALVQARPLVLPGASLADLRALVRASCPVRTFEPTATSGRFDEFVQA